MLRSAMVCRCVPERTYCSSRTHPPTSAGPLGRLQANLDIWQAQASTCLTIPKSDPASFSSDRVLAAADRHRGYSAPSCLLQRFHGHM